MGAPRPLYYALAPTARRENPRQPFWRRAFCAPRHAPHAPRTGPGGAPASPPSPRGPDPEVCSHGRPRCRRLTLTAPAPRRRKSRQPFWRCGFPPPATPRTYLPRPREALPRGSRRHTSPWPRSSALAALVPQETPNRAGDAAKKTAPAPLGVSFFAARHAPHAPPATPGGRPSVLTSVGWSVPAPPALPSRQVRLSDSPAPQWRAEKHRASHHGRRAPPPGHAPHAPPTTSGGPPAWRASP